MKKITELLAILLITGWAVAAHATLIEFKQEFSSGFNVSINGGTLAPSGPITIVGIVDDSAPDIDPSFRGEFALTSVTFTGAGFVNEAVTTPLGLLVFSLDKFAFQLLGQFNVGITGWNGSTSSGNFITDQGDLTTLLSIPYTTTGTSTFWFDGLAGNAWTLASGDTIGASIGAGGPNGTFSISQAGVIPEPATLALFGLGLVGFAFKRKKA